MSFEQTGAVILSTPKHEVQRLDLNFGGFFQLVLLFLSSFSEVVTLHLASDLTQ